MLAAIAAAACFLIGLNMAGRAALPERAGISSGAKLKGDNARKTSPGLRREDRDENKREKERGEKGEKTTEGASESKKPMRPWIAIDSPSLRTGMKVRVKTRDRGENRARHA